MKLGSGDMLAAIYMLAEGESRSVEVKGKEIAVNRLHIGSRDTKGTKK